ncbi:hypothetical protein MJO28_017517 [Puccinia striiformis f. sp. tritici]|uniref:CDP-diacylglycerol--glycerol-3-phosphate 3-phosphatidyltransferase n=1 Tax=Puccinia striiformis TaxID=27350 RepID=A0A2S4VI39_9BASI|nr:hypothetical protein MJO28_017517 [Puccinia striiformis f. sp. tritici]POW09149.1 hypothetical protein PSTT_07064 [Puccinia striiformis]
MRFKPTSRPVLRVPQPTNLRRLNHHCTEYRSSAEPRDIDGLVNHLSSNLPYFRSPQDSIKVLNEPAQFYHEILNLINKAKKRIFIASLYVGKEEINLIEALGKALETNPDLKLTILVDYLRTTREHNKPRVQGEICCSASLLKRLLKTRFGSRVEIRLFHTSELYGTLKKLIPRRFDEGFGLQHMKIYGSDNDIIMSGANLSTDYFTNRQDRYVMLTDQEGLSEYLSELIEITSSISYRLIEGKGEELEIIWPDSNPCQPPISSRSASQQFKKIANLLYTEFTDRWRAKSLSLIGDHNHLHPRIPSVSIFPTLQMSPFKIHHETHLMIPQLINFVNRPLSSHNHSPPKSKIVLNWTSGYFSLLREYKKSMLESNGLVQIITASPQANGFYNSKGVSKYIPLAYSYLENLFRTEIRKSNKEDQILIRRWNRNGWTYHAKGLWINELNKTEPGNKEEEEERCLVNSIGSSNYGRRSAERDLECNLFIVLDDPPTLPSHPERSNKTDDCPLSIQLVNELHHLKSHVSNNDQSHQHVGIFVKLFTRLIRTML